MVWMSSQGWRHWLEANLGRRPTTLRGGAGGEMGVGQEERWRPQEDANDGNGDAAKTKDTARKWPRRPATVGGRREKKVLVRIFFWF